MAGEILTEHLDGSYEGILTVGGRAVDMVTSTVMMTATGKPALLAEDGGRSVRPDQMSSAGDEQSRRARVRDLFEQLTVGDVIGWMVGKRGGIE